MSEAVTRQRPSIDLDEFERRMRQSYAAGHEDDPLAELARLVGEQDDPYQDVFAQEAVAHAPHQNADGDAYADNHETYGERREPGFDSPAHLTGFAAIEAGLRGTLSPEVAAPDVHDGHDQYRGHDQYQGYDEQAYDQAPAGMAMAPEPKSRRSTYLVGGLIAFGILGVGGVFALKGHGTTPSDVQTIMAASGPTKVQPPAEIAPDSGSSDSAGLGKAQPAPSKLVNNEEEPVDVAQAARDNAAKDGAQQSTDAASVPVPPSPGQVESGASQSAVPPMMGAGDFALGMPAPKKVKVVSVRPDGTILSDPQSAPEAQAAPRQDDPAPPVADAPAPQAAPPVKSASRVLPKHVAAGTNGSDTTAAPKHKAKPQKLAMADPADSSQADAAPAPKSSGGGFAVQLAAPGSEADARSTSSKLAKKFANALEGRRLGFHKADSNGKTVYRVRVGSLSRDEATSLCEKLKSDGGTCFVAHN